MTEAEDIGRTRTAPGGGWDIKADLGGTGGGNASPRLTC